MNLQEAIKIAEEIRAVAAAMDKTKQAVALDVLIQHAKQPVQVTREMVEASVDAMFAVLGKNRDLYTMLRHDQLIDASKAALQAALNVQGGE